MIFQIQVQIAGREPHWETYDKKKIRTLAEAGAWGLEIVSGFNETLCHGEEPRTYLAVREMGEDD